MFVSETIARITDQCAGLPEGRVQGAAEFTTLLRAGRLPAAPVFAFVLPLGLVPRNDGDAAAGAFIQAVDEQIGVVLVVQAAGDGTGRTALPSIETLIGQLNAALPGWQPDGAIGPLRLRRGRLLSAENGAVIYQLDYAVQTQLRNIS